MNKSTNKTLWIVHFAFMLICAIFVGISLSALHASKTATGSVTFSISSSPDITMNMNFDVGTNSVTYLGTSQDAKLTTNSNVLVANIEKASALTITAKFDGSTIGFDSNVILGDESATSGTTKIQLSNGSTLTWAKTTENGTDTITFAGTASLGEALVLDNILCAIHPLNEVSNQPYEITITAQETDSSPATATISGNYSATMQNEIVNFVVNSSTNYGTISTSNISVPYNTSYTVNGKTIVFNDENNSTITATPNANDAQYSYAFSAWQIDGQDVTSGTGTIREGSTITAIFTRTTKTYQVTAVSNNTAYGTVSITNSAQLNAVPYDTTYTVTDNTISINGATITATPQVAGTQYRYVFSKWQANGQDISNNTGTIIGETTITAIFKQQPNTVTVQFVSNNTSYGTVSTSSVIVPYETTYTVSGNQITFADSTNTIVTATPNTDTAQYNYEFSSWTVSQGTLGEAITSSITLTANFTQELQYYTVSFVIEDHTTDYAGPIISHDSVYVPYGTTYVDTSQNTWTGQLTFTYNNSEVAIVNAYTRNTAGGYFAYWSTTSGTIRGNLTIIGYFDYACCISADSLISLGDGQYKRVDEVVVGDYVLSMNMETGAYELNKVTEVITVHRTKTYSVVLKDGTELEITADHPMYTERGWVTVGGADYAYDISPDVVQEEPLAIGDKIKTTKGYIEVISITQINYEIPELVYNLKVENNHNFFANDMLIHNGSIVGCAYG